MLQEVRVFHRRYFSLRVNNQDFMQSEQTKKSMVCQWTLGRNSTENTWRPPVGHSKEKKPPFQLLPLVSYHSQGFGQWKEIGRATTPTRFVEEVFIPGRIQACRRKEKEYKKWWSTRKRGLELKSWKRLFVKKKPVIALMSNVSIYLSIVECNFCFSTKR